MPQLVAGNWKMNGLRAEAMTLCEALRAGAKGLACHLLVCPPATVLAEVARALGNTPIGVGGQDCAPERSGAHTGDISAPMLRDAGANFVILGHSERRHGHGETSAQVRAKAGAAMRAGLTPIICVGETEAERDSGRAQDVVGEQVRDSVPPGFTGVLAYEPVWAIGTGKTASEADVGRHACLYPCPGWRGRADPLWRLGQARQCRRPPRAAEGRRRAGRRRELDRGRLPRYRPRCRPQGPDSMTTVLLVVHLFVTLALIGVVLIQRSEGGGLGIGNSQGMGAFMGGRGTANLLTRTTAVLATVVHAAGPGAGRAQPRHRGRGQFDPGHAICPQLRAFWPARAACAGQHCAGHPCTGDQRASFVSQSSPTPAVPAAPSGPQVPTQ